MKLDEDFRRVPTSFLQCQLEETRISDWGNNGKRKKVRHDTRSLEEVKSKWSAKKARLSNRPTAVENRERSNQSTWCNQNNRPPPLRSVYNYVTLSSLSRDGPKCKVDVYGVIVGFSPIKMTKSGSQKFYISYFVIDESMDNPGAAVVLNYFSDDIEKIPVPLFVGDILRCHRVKSKPYRNQTQLTGQDTITSLVIISRKREIDNGLPVILDGNEIEGNDDETDFSNSLEIQHNGVDNVYEKLSPHVWNVLSVRNNNTFTSHDVDRVNSLLTWSENILMKNFLGSATRQYFTLDELDKLSICENDAMTIERLKWPSLHPFFSPITCDLVAMVVSIVDTSESSYIFVWDGTTDGNMDTPSFDVESFDLVHVKRSLHAAWEYVSILDSASFYNEASRSIIRNSRDVRELCQFRLLGEVRKIALVEQGVSINSSLRYIKSGSWVKFRDLSCITTGRQEDLPNVIGSVTQSTSVIPLHQFCKDVTTVVKKYLNRYQREVTRLRSSTLRGSKNPHHDLLATCVSAELPKRYNLKARIVDWYPSDIYDFVKPSSPSTSRKFLFSLRIIDAVMTAHIDVIFTSTHGDAEFLLGVSADEFASSSQVRLRILNRLQELKVFSF